MVRRVVFATVKIEAWIPEDDESIENFEERMADRILDIPEMIEATFTVDRVNPEGMVPDGGY